MGLDELTVIALKMIVGEYFQQKHGGPLTIANISREKLAAQGASNVVYLSPC